MPVFVLNLILKNASNGVLQTKCGVGCGHSSCMLV